MALDLLVYVAVFGCSVVVCILPSSEATGGRVDRNIPNLFSYGADAFTSYKGAYGEHAVFPPGLKNTPFFSDHMDFTTFQDRILIGAADELYLLDLDLSPVENGVLHWNVSQTKFHNCSSNQNYKDNANYYCRNHIRIYSRYPAEPDVLYVCGTQAFSTAQCRAVNVSGGVFGEAYEATDVSQRILSVDPDYPSYGRFRDLPGDNTSFISWFFYRDSVNYLYAFEVQDIQWNQSTKTMRNTFEFGKLDNWISEPMYIVDFIDLSYELTEASATRNFDYYYAFIRERDSYKLDYTTNAEPGSLSYVVRVCQDDPGVNYTDNTPQSFGTALKARLYCDFEGPNTGDNPLAARDMRYNDIWSVTFSKTGVDGRIGSERILMYAAFSGPLTGPPGAAICTFSAEARQPLSDNQRNKGLFDTFREDIILGPPDAFTAESQNYFDCTGQSRPSEGSTSTVTSKSILVSEWLTQISGNPLLILDGYYVTTMTTDVTCVVMKDDRARCQVLDVLFVGTSNGTVLKAWGGEHLDKVVAEDISLEPNIYVRDLRVKEVNKTKFIYASTLPRLYKLSMGRCGRHKSLSVCIESRDPYCVWNGMNSACELAELNSTRPVPSYILQNIFDGFISNLVNVTLTSERYDDVIEGNTIDVEILANGTVPDGMLSVILYQGESIVRGTYSVTGLNANTSVTVTVTIPDDQQFSGTRSYSVCLQSDESGVALFAVRCAKVSVIDNDASSVSLSQSLYEVVEGNTLDVMILANKTVPDGLGLALTLYQENVIVHGPLSVNGLITTVIVPVMIPYDKRFLGRQDYSVRLHASASGAIVFQVQNATVTVIDRDGFLAQVGLKDLDDVCERWRVTGVDSKLKALDDAIMNGIGGGFRIERNGLYCSTRVNQLYVAVYRFNITTQNSNAPELAQALRTWVNKEEKIFPFSFTVDSACISQILSLQEDLCGLLVGSPLSASSGPPSEVVGLVVVLVVSLVVNILLLMGLILMCYWYKKSASQVTAEEPVKVKLNNGSSSAHQSKLVPSSLPPQTHTEEQTSSDMLEKRDLSEKQDQSRSPPPNLCIVTANQQMQNGLNSPAIDSSAPLLDENGQDSREPAFDFQAYINIPVIQECDESHYSAGVSELSSTVTGTSTVNENAAVTPF